jgi:sec-independent protein translocase protein TatC
MSQKQIMTDQSSFMEHVTELRNRLIYCVVALLIASIGAYIYVEDIYGFLVKPLADAMHEGDSQRLIYTNLTEAFFTYMKVSLFTGAFITFPFILLQIWRFIAPGLYREERNTVWPFLVSVPILFFMGGALVYYIVIPLAWNFFLSFQSTGADTVLPIMLEARVGDYLDLIMTLIFAFGVCFQMPVLMGLLGKAGILKSVSLVKFRRYAVVAIFIVAAILTPPDIISQISLAIPLMALYEISILLIRRLEPKDHGTSAA